MAIPWFRFPQRYIASSFFGDPKYDTLFLWLAANVLQFEQVELICGREVVLRPGQIVIGRFNAATSLGLSEKVYRDRINTLKKGQLLDRDTATGKTRITIIDPDTYEWQKGIYSIKRASKFAKNGPAKGQRRASDGDGFDSQTSPLSLRAGAPAKQEVEEVKDIVSFGARACREGEETELSEEEYTRFEAQFSPTKKFVLDTWKAERERYQLRYVKSPRNFRVADSVTAMIDAGDWTSDDWREAVKNFMANEWAREHCGMNALYEEFERWLNGGQNEFNSRHGGSSKSSRLGRKRDYGNIVTGEAL